MDGLTCSKCLGYSENLCLICVTGGVAPKHCCTCASLRLSGSTCTCQIFSTHELENSH